jgi:ribosomal protein L35
MYEKPNRESKMPGSSSSIRSIAKRAAKKRFRESTGKAAMSHASSMDAHKAHGRKTSSIRELAKMNRKK